MKCAVLVQIVTLCAVSATAFRGAASRRGRQYYSGDVSSGYQQSYQQDVSYQPGVSQHSEEVQQNYQYSGEAAPNYHYQLSGEATPNYQYQLSGEETPNYQLSGEATPSYQYQPQYQQISNQNALISNSIDSYQQHYQPQYYPAVNPTQGTPIQYAAPLAPYPPQFNVHQQAQYGQQQQLYIPQQQYGPLPGYTDLFGPTSAPGVTLTKPTVVTTTKGTTKPSTTQQPNNIFSLLLSLSQSSSGLSQPRTTKRPAATITTTLATAQPPPKPQIYSFANLPSPFAGQSVYYSQRRLFNPFSLQQ